MVAGRGRRWERRGRQANGKWKNGIVMNIIILISSWFQWESWNLISFSSDVHQSEEKNGGQLIVICETQEPFLRQFAIFSLLFFHYIVFRRLFYFQSHYIYFNGFHFCHAFIRNIIGKVCLILYNDLFEESLFMSWNTQLHWITMKEQWHDWEKVICDISYKLILFLTLYWWDFTVGQRHMGLLTNLLCSRAIQFCSWHPNIVVYFQTLCLSRKMLWLNNTNLWLNSTIVWLSHTFCCWCPNFVVEA